MRLNKDQGVNPAREMTWNGVSLANCSRQELIACVIHLARQLSIAQGRIDQLNGVQRGIGIHIDENGKATSRALVRGADGEVREDPGAQVEQPTVTVGGPVPEGESTEVPGPSADIG